MQTDVTMASSLVEMAIGSSSEHHVSANVVEQEISRALAESGLNLRLQRETVVDVPFAENQIRIKRQASMVINVYATLCCNGADPFFTGVLGRLFAQVDAPRGRDMSELALRFRPAKNPNGNDFEAHATLPVELRIARHVR